MKYGLVLAGGGVRGAYHVGVCRAIKELGVEISAVSGASIGAINGALFVQGDIERAQKMWEKIAIDDVVAIPESVEIDENLFKISNLKKLAKEIYKNAGLDMSPLEELLTDMIDEEKIRTSPIDFGVAAYSLTDRNEQYLFKEDIPDGRLVEYLMASACLPGFKAKTIDKKKFVDGGVSNNMPVNMIIEKGIDNIITVDVKGVGVYKSFNLAGRNVIDIRCSDPQTGTMDFNREGITKSISSGYFGCMKAFGRFMGNIYSFRTEDYYRARAMYSNEFIKSIEYAAHVFDVDEFRLYTVEELIDEMMGAYYDYAAEQRYSGGETLAEMLRKVNDNMLVSWLVWLLENGKSDFIKEKLSVIGANYDAASAILYFKHQK